MSRRNFKTQRMAHHEIHTSKSKELQKECSNLLLSALKIRPTNPSLLGLVKKFGLQKDKMDDVSLMRFKNSVRGALGKDSKKLPNK